MKPFTTLAVLVFALVAVVHVFRLIRGLQIVVGSHTIPLWTSAVGAIVAGLLAIMVWRESRRP
jgi:chromate transport protein ChrA